MMYLRMAFWAVGLVAGTLQLLRAEVLLQENFDALTPGPISTQGGWSDSSKLGEAEVMASGSFSEPNHLQAWEGGAVHHEIEPWTSSPNHLTLGLAARLKASESGRNLQISLKGKSGAPVLFINLRGSGRSLDIGTNAEFLTEYSLASELPKDEWFLLHLEWSILTGQAELKVTSPDGATEYLQEQLTLPFEAPARVILGSTSKTRVEDWALDDLRIEVRD